MYRLIQNTKLRAIGWMVLNCFMSASVLLVVRYISPNFSVAVLISSYHLVAVILVSSVILYFGYSIKTKILYLHFIRSLLGVVAYFMYFYALSITSMANVIALSYMDGILTCLFSYIFLKEYFGRMEALNIALSFIGALMIIKPNIHIINIGAFLAGVAAMLWALSNVLIKIIGKEDNEYVQLFYSNFFTFFLAMIYVIYEGSILDMLDVRVHWDCIILLAIMGSLQAFALFKSLNLAKASVVMPFFIVSVVFVHIYGYVFFDEIQGVIEIIGTVLVVSVGVFQIFQPAPLDSNR